MTRLDRIAPFDEANVLQAIVETPRGSGNKLKYLPADDVMSVDHPLPVGLTFPCDFGFVPSTLAEDGDPLDILVLLDSPGYPGSLVKVRLLGVIEVEQTDRDMPTIRNDRLVGLAVGSTTWGNPRSVRDLPPGYLDQIASFFETYNQLRGKRFKVMTVRGVRAARGLIAKARRTAET